MFFSLVTPRTPQFNIDSSRLSLKILPFPGNNFASENLPDCNIKFGGAGGMGWMRCCCSWEFPGSYKACVFGTCEVFSVHCPRWNFFVLCRFMFQVISKLDQICVCTSVLWNRCLRMLCSGGLQRLSSGRSGAAVLGTNAQTLIAESFHL